MVSFGRNIADDQRAQFPEQIRPDAVLGHVLAKHNQRLDPPLRMPSAIRGRSGPGLGRDARQCVAPPVFGLRSAAKQESVAFRLSEARNRS